MIVKSEIVSDALQISPSRRWIVERHTDHLNLVQEFAHYVALGEDANVIMLARVATINADLTAREIAANLAAVATLGAQAAPVFNYSTAAQNFAGLRLAYATMTRTDAIMAGDFLSSLTDAQLQTAFGLTAAQVTTLRSSKLTPAATAAATIRAAAGV